MDLVRRTGHRMRERRANRPRREYGERERPPHLPRRRRRLLQPGHVHRHRDRLIDIEVAKYFTSGFTATEFGALVNHADAPIEFPDQGGIFDRTVANNPFKNSSWVYIPY